MTIMTALEEFPIDFAKRWEVASAPFLVAVHLQLSFSLSFAVLIVDHEKKQGDVSLRDHVDYCGYSLPILPSWMTPRRVDSSMGELSIESTERNRESPTPQPWHTGKVNGDAFDDHHHGKP